jgi:hypothetical protein
VFFQTRSQLVKNSINSKLFNREKGLYIDGENSSHSSLHANMFPLAFGLVPPQNLKSVLAFIKSRGMACSVYGSQFLLEGLYNAGESDYAFDLLTSTSDRSWWNMIRIGSTITLEAWDMKYKPNSDWNHAWGAAPANIISQELWGIKPLIAGYGIVRIKPQLSKLSNSKIRVPTIKGPIDAEFRKENNSEVYTIDLPDGMKGKFLLPSKKFSSVYLNNVKLAPDSSVINLISGHNAILINGF